MKEGYTVKDASEELGLKFSTAKSIVKMYREDGKLFKNEMMAQKQKQLTKKKNSASDISIKI